MYLNFYFSYFDRVNIHKWGPSPEVPTTTKASIPNPSNNEQSSNAWLSKSPLPFEKTFCLREKKKKIELSKGKYENATSIQFSLLPAFLILLRGSNWQICLHGRANLFPAHSKAEVNNCWPEGKFFFYLSFTFFFF